MLPWIKNRKVIGLIIVAALIVFVIFGAKIILIVNLLMGNDILLQLDTKDEQLTLIRGQNKTVVFEADITTNPFCKAVCHSTFNDISGNQSKKESDFSIRPGDKFEAAFMVAASKYGNGQELYRFDIECYGVSTMLCKTSGEPTMRSTVLTLNYGPSEEEKQLLELFKKDLNNLSHTKSKQESEALILNQSLDMLESKVIVPGLRQSLNLTLLSITQNKQVLQDLEDAWKHQNIKNLSNQVQDFRGRLEETQNNIDYLNRTIAGNTTRHNYIADHLDTIRESLLGLELHLSDNLFEEALRAAIANLSKVQTLYNEQLDIETKEGAVKQLNKSVKDLNQQLKVITQRQAMRVLLETDRDYDAVCLISDMCVSHASITERAAQSLNLTDACKYRDEFTSFVKSYENTSNENKSHAEAILTKIRTNITTNYLNILPANKRNTKLIKQILPTHNTTVINEHHSNLTLSLIKQEPPCTFSAPQTVPVLTISKIVPATISHSIIHLNFEEVEPQCCVGGQCNECCTSIECFSQQDIAPVIFLHGHALNKKTQAEYSLDAFNQLQQGLEGYGYLNAGSLSLLGKAGRIQARVPLTIKATYYLDLFENPENSIIVKTKSESIDTYAVKLSEIINKVEKQTGRPKVHIVAHSMGGLVARRYIQIVGIEKVASLTMIATPNKGIEGSIADFCETLGEKNECRDMTANSLFLNKLNRGSVPEIPIHNIIGVGCGSDGSSDGFVTEKNARLEGAANYVINGTCSATKPLHTDLLKIDQHPEVLEVVLSALTIEEK